MFIKNIIIFFEKIHYINYHYLILIYNFVKKKLIFFLFFTIESLDRKFSTNI